MAPTLHSNSTGYTETEISLATTPKTNSNIHHFIKLRGQRLTIYDSKK